MYMFEKKKALIIYVFEGPNYTLVVIYTYYSFLTFYILF